MSEAFIVGSVFIIAFIVLGIVTVTFLYFRNRERQLMVEKGVTAEQIGQMFKQKKIQPYSLLQLGIVILFFGSGLGGGILLEDAGYSEGWIPFLIFTSAGLGFIVSFFVSRKVRIADNNLKSKDSLDEI
ncbi:MAG: DUF6249 domain-containing protein [Melioribacteraceae bacterium]